MSRSLRIPCNLWVAFTLAECGDASGFLRIPCNLWVAIIDTGSGGLRDALRSPLNQGSFDLSSPDSRPR